VFFRVFPCGMHFLLPIATLWWREQIRFYRQRSRLLGALGTPLVFWLFIGSGIGNSFHPPSTTTSISYLEYFYPGTIILAILFTAIFSTISIIEDRKEGFLLSVLASPIPRSSLVLGKILGGATLALFQGVLFLLLASVVGIPLDFPKFVQLVAILFLIAFSLTALGFTFAWHINSTQGFHAVMNLLFFPMWLLSGALFPPSGASGWIQWIMQLNPLTYGLTCIRHIFYAENSAALVGFPTFTKSILILVGFSVIVFLASLFITQKSAISSQK